MKMQWLRHNETLFAGSCINSINLYSYHLDAMRKMKRSPYMNKKIFICAICVSLLLSGVFLPPGSYALDAGAADMVVLDSQTFVVSKEFAGEIKLYVCSVKDGRITIRDATSIPYMTIEHRDLFKSPARDTLPGDINSPIIKTIP